MFRFPILQLLSLALLLVVPPALAEDLASAPGWTLNKMQETKADNDFTVSDGRVFFALKPPDQRPAVTVDSRTADRLRSGEMAAEAAYGGQNPRANTKDEEYVYGNKANGLVIPEPPNSTLTLADGRKDSPQVEINGQQAKSASSGTSGLSGLGTSSSGSSSPRRSYASSGASAPRNASGASGPPPAASGGENAAPSGPGVTDPRAVAMAQQEKQLEANKGPAIAGIQANNAASGFGVTKAEKGKDGKDGDKDKNFIIWPNGEPGANNDGKPYCGQTMHKVFDRPGLTRIPGQKGCPTLKVHVWGAGGGTGGVGSDGSTSGGRGGTGAYVYTSGIIDVSKFDVVVVVGSEGRHAHGHKGGPDTQFGGGGKGGDSEDGLGGGGGGGFSGVFLIPHGTAEGDMPLDPDKAIAIASGGGGGSSSGAKGGAGGITKGEGLGGSANGGGPGNGNGSGGASLLGGQGGSGTAAQGGGGGGGGGLFGGGGGGASGTDDGPSVAGGGGSSFYRFLDSYEGKGGGADKPGNENHPERGSAGEPGQAGRVVLEFL